MSKPKVLARSKRAKTLAVDELKQAVFARRPGAAREWEQSAPRRHLAQQLTELRVRAGLTQAQLAKALGWDQARVSRIESVSGPFPTIRTISLYAAACGVKTGIRFHLADRPEERPAKPDLEVRVDVENVESSS